MLTNYNLDPQFYQNGTQSGEPHVTYRFGGLQLNTPASSGYQNRSNSMSHSDASHNYVDSKLYDHQSNDHGHTNVIKSEYVPKDQSNGPQASFKSPDLPLQSWNTSNSVRPSPPSSLSCVSATADSARGIDVATAVAYRSMSDTMHYYSNPTAMNPNFSYPWMGMQGKRGNFMVLFNYHFYCLPQALCNCYICINANSALFFFAQITVCHP